MAARRQTCRGDGRSGSDPGGSGPGPGCKGSCRSDSPRPAVPVPAPRAPGRGPAVPRVERRAGLDDGAALRLVAAVGPRRRRRRPLRCGPPGLVGGPRAGAHRGGLRRGPPCSTGTGGERWWAGVFARLVAGHLCRRASWLDDFDLVVAMPAYGGPGARRGWDPVGDVATGLSRLVGPAWGLRSGVPAKTVETEAMGGPTSGARRRTAEVELRSAPLRRRPRRRRRGQGSSCSTWQHPARGGRARRRAGAQEVAGLVLSRPDRPGEGRNR
jgi:hypothetical protein